MLCLNRWHPVFDLYPSLDQQPLKLALLTGCQKLKWKRISLPKVLRVDWVLNVGRGRWVSLPKKIFSLNRHNSSLNPKEWPIRISTVAEVWGVEWTEGVVGFQ